MSKSILPLLLCLMFSSPLFAKTNTFVVTIEVSDRSLTLEEKKKWGSSLSDDFNDHKKLEVHRWVVKNHFDSLIVQAVVTGRLHFIEHVLKDISPHHQKKVIPLDKYYFRVSYKWDSRWFLKFSLGKSLLTILKNNNFKFYQVVGPIMGEDCFAMRALKKCMDYLAPFIWDQYPLSANSLLRELERVITNKEDLFFGLDAKFGPGLGHPYDLILDQNDLFHSEDRLGQINNINGDHVNELFVIKQSLVQEMKKRDFYKLITISNYQNDNQDIHSYMVDRLHKKIRKNNYQVSYRVSTSKKEYFLLKRGHSETSMKKIEILNDEFHEWNVWQRDLYNFLLVLHFKFLDQKNKMITTMEYPIYLNRAGSIEKIKKMNFDGKKLLNTFFLGNSDNFNDVWSLFFGALAHGPLIYDKAKLMDENIQKVKKIAVSMTLEGYDSAFSDRFSQEYINGVIFSYNRLPLKDSAQQWNDHFPVLKVNSPADVQEKLGRISDILNL